MSRIQIISDGTAQGTTVRTMDGRQLDGVASITISPITPGEMVKAQITFNAVVLRMMASPDIRVVDSERTSEDECKTSDMN